MAWRVIVRVGMTSDTASAVRNTALFPEFRAMGLSNTATGTWEASFVDPLLAAARLNNVLNTLANPSAVTGSSPDVSLKHLWVYIDYQLDSDPSDDDEEV